MGVTLLSPALFAWVAFDPADHASTSALDRCSLAMVVARRSRCPSSLWKANASIALLEAHDTSAPLIYFNAGANKGFAVAEFLQRFHDDGGNAPSNAAWFKAVRAIKPSGMFSCGMCGACKDPLPPPEERHNRSVRVFAFELLKSNAWLLGKLFQRHRVPGRALNVAVGNYTGTAWAPTGVRTGQEWSSAELGVGAGGGKLTPVPSITVDAFSQSEGLHVIDWLSIDAEGWDALVLQGGRSMLSQRRIHLLEFEYHSKGMWAASQPPADRRDLAVVLRDLNAFGYTCFWQGDGGGLAQASGAAWCPSFEWRGHSNLVCSHLDRIIDALRVQDCSAALSSASRAFATPAAAATMKAAGGAMPSCLQRSKEIRRQHRAAYAD